jgi:predicted RNA binding protein YcfA (HicA-like mRNA interferase family)
VYAALQRIGWRLDRQVGSHRRFVRPGWGAITLAFHQRREIGPTMLAKIGKRTGLRPEDL